MDRRIHFGSSGWHQAVEGRLRGVEIGLRGVEVGLREVSDGSRKVSGRSRKVSGRSRRVSGRSRKALERVRRSLAALGMTNYDFLHKHVACHPEESATRDLSGSLSPFGGPRWITDGENCTSRSLPFDKLRVGMTNYDQVVGAEVLRLASLAQDDKLE